MEYDDPEACRDPNCAWLFPHKADDSCFVDLDMSRWNDDDDPSLMWGA